MVNYLLRERLEVFDEPLDAEAQSVLELARLGVDELFAVGDHVRDVTGPAERRRVEAQLVRRQRGEVEQHEQLALGEVHLLLQFRQSLVLRLVHVRCARQRHLPLSAVGLKPIPIKDDAVAEN